MCEFYGQELHVTYLTRIGAWSPLIVREAKDFLYSKEGVTQGDPISMYMYAIATLPLIRTLKDISKWTQIWYADDSCVGGSLSNIKEWFNHLCKVGPTYGYYPKPCKSYLIVNESNFANAKEVFKDTDVKIVKGGRLLGGFVGDKAKRDLFVTEKVQTWCKSIEKISVDITHSATSGIPCFGSNPSNLSGSSYNELHLTAVYYLLG